MFGAGLRLPRAGYSTTAYRVPWPHPHRIPKLLEGILELIPAQRTLPAADIVRCGVGFEPTGSSV